MRIVPSAVWPAIVPLVLVSARIPAQDVHWVAAETLTIEGRGFDDAASPFDRLPARAEKLVREPVWRLSLDSAGLAIRFATDADRIRLRYALRNATLAMPHMPATGVSGFDLYAHTESGWRELAAARPTAREQEVELVSGLPRERRDLVLYLPLYNGVEHLEIGVPPAARSSRRNHGTRGRSCSTARRSPRAAAPRVPEPVTSRSSAAGSTAR